MPPFIVVVVYNYRIAYYVEVFLYQLAQQVNLNIKLDYSGTIIVGRELKKRFLGRAFTGPYSYAKTYELMFEEGILLDSKETSGTYFGF